MKSPLLLGSDAPHVHLRLRKRLSRCTLDCGFQTPESPALRGFEAERGRFATTSLYLVLLSNGLHRPKIRLKKFGFSLKTVPANIAKKLPSQTLSQTVSHPDFQLLSQTPHVCFHGRKCVHTRPCSKNRTQRPTRRNTGLPDGAAITTLGAFRTFTNIPGPGIRKVYFAAFGSWLDVLPKNAESLGTAMRLCASLFRGAAAPLGCVIFFASAEIAVSTPCAQGLSVCAR